MIACFLSAELTSERFGTAIRDQLAAAGHTEELLTRPVLSDEQANAGRRAVLAATGGYGESRELFDADFPTDVRWMWVRLDRDELTRVRYMDYSYRNELSGGSRLPLDAAKRINAGIEIWEVSNRRFLSAARAIARGERLPPLILVGQQPQELVCLEGHLRLTAYALAGFPDELDCLVGTAPSMRRWAH